MKRRIAIGAAVLAVVVGLVVGCVVALAGGSTGRPVQSAITNPARYWLSQHAFLAPEDGTRIDVAEVARTLLGLEPGFRAVHHVDTATSLFDDELLTQACTYVFGHAGRVNQVAGLHRFRFDLQASGPNVSPRRPGGVDHDGYALQCGYSHGALGARLLQLSVSSGGLTVHNLTSYATARSHDVTAGFRYSTKPPGLAAESQLQAFLLRRLARATYLDD